ncbi:MAG: OmpA family protein, partial [Muribaculaceae bacterium]|nr:OmpA family protein [Muribaculaceae bacterium]
DSELDLKDRIMPAAGLWLGKWFSPIVGIRVGGNFLSTKGVGDSKYSYGATGNMVGNYYETRINEFGAIADVMVNLTNWWCGYRPGRVYNATVYGGANGYWSYIKDGKGDWEKGGDRTIGVNAGLINNFNLNKHIGLYLDIRWTMLANHNDEMGGNRCAHDVAAYLGLTYNFNSTTWSAPIVPVIEAVPDCSAIEARLQAANARINELEAQLQDCLNRPVQVKEVKEEGPLATIYYPIGVSKLTNVDRKVLGAVAEVMKNDPSQNYVLTGWADNYTGTDQINVRLRQARVDGVKNYLVKSGVNAAQLDATINNGNLYGQGIQYVSLDRAVTIEKAK